MRDFSNNSDEDLVALFKKGEEQAFDELYIRYSSRLVKVIYYYVGDVDSAEDVLHEAFMRVIRHLDTYKSDRAFSSWIFQIAINCSKNHIKKSKRKDELFERITFNLPKGGGEAPSPEEDLISSLEIEAFNRAVERLKPKFQEVMLLRTGESMKYSDIAAVLGCSERTAKWRMKKAVELIIQDLKEEKLIK